MEVPLTLWKCALGIVRAEPHGMDCSHVLHLTPCYREKRSSVLLQKFFLQGL